MAGFHHGHVGAAVALVLLMAGCTSEPAPIRPEQVLGGDGSGGGSIVNTNPTWVSFTGSLASADNSGGTQEVFTGRVSDPNTEVDLAQIRVVVSGVVNGTFVHNVTFEETLALTEPGSYGNDHFKVWTSSLDDGELWFKFRYAYPLGTPAGSAAFTPSARDVLAATTGGAWVEGPADATTVTLFSRIEFGTAPVGADGSPSSSNWGNWNAIPGAPNVEGTNFLKVTNSGQDPAAQVVVDFSEADFVGTDNPNFTIPIANNVQFAWHEDTTPGTTAPSEGSYPYLQANADGSVTLSFTGLGHIIYVKYRVGSLPAVLPIQSYAATYTATEV